MDLPLLRRRAPAHRPLPLLTVLPKAAASASATRIDLAVAAGYFGNVTGTLSLATTDMVNVPATVGAGRVLDANGILNGATTVPATGTLTGSSRVSPALYKISFSSGPK